MKASRVIDLVIIALGVLLLLWIGFSWVDVIADNLSANPTHSAWNCFRLLIGE